MNIIKNNIKYVRENFFSKKQIFKYNLIICSFCLLINFVFQFFCVPPFWAWILVIISIGAFITYPVYRSSNKLQYVYDIFYGITFFFICYVIIFIRDLHIIGLFAIFFIIGLIVFIPHLMLLQVIWFGLIYPVKKHTRLFFLFGVFLCVFVSFEIGNYYKSISDKIRKSSYSELLKIKDQFMVEPIIGMHFKYHTRYTFYDGWRPPVHNPFIVIGLFLNNYADPLDSISLEKRIKLYKKIYPHNKIRLCYSCALNESWTYFSSPLLKSQNFEK